MQAVKPLVMSIDQKLKTWRRRRARGDKRKNITRVASARALCVCGGVCAWNNSGALQPSRAKHPQPCFFPATPFQARLGVFCAAQVSCRSAIRLGRTTHWSAGSRTSIPLPLCVCVCQCLSFRGRGRVFRPAEPDMNPRRFTRAPEKAKVQFSCFGVEPLNLGHCSQQWHFVQNIPPPPKKLIYS